MVAKSKWTNGQTINYKTIHRTHLKPGVKSCGSEG